MNAHRERDQNNMMVRFWLSTLPINCFRCGELKARKSNGETVLTPEKKKNYTKSNQ